MDRRHGRVTSRVAPCSSKARLKNLKKYFVFTAKPLEGAVGGVGAGFTFVERDDVIGARSAGPSGADVIPVTEGGGAGGGEIQIGSITLQVQIHSVIEKNANSD